MIYCCCRQQYIIHLLHPSTNDKGERKDEGVKRDTSKISTSHDQMTVCVTRIDVSNGWRGCFPNWDAFSHSNDTSFGWRGCFLIWDAFSHSSDTSIGWHGYVLNWDAFSHTNDASIGWRGRSPNWDAFSHTRPVVTHCSSGVGTEVALGLPDCQQT